mgnify:CR=1 FL=1
MVGLHPPIHVPVFRVKGTTGNNWEQLGTTELHRQQKTQP